MPLIAFHYISQIKNNWFFPQLILQTNEYSSRLILSAWLLPLLLLLPLFDPSLVLPLNWTKLSVPICPLVIWSFPDKTLMAYTCNGITFFFCSRVKMNVMMCETAPKMTLNDTFILKSIYICLLWFSRTFSCISY